MSSITDFQTVAFGKAEDYAARLKTFTDLLYSQSLVGAADQTSKIPPLDTSGVQHELTALLASIGNTPPNVLPGPGQPVITVPTPTGMSSAPVLFTPSTIAPPSIVFAPAPELGQTSFSGAREAIVSPLAAARPTVALPTLPSFDNIVLPTITDVGLPTFPTLTEIDIPNDATDLFSFSEEPYTSALLDEAKAKLLVDLGGGYGIELADELALWSRAREREQRAAEAAIQDSARQMSARGFSMPPGAMWANIQGAQQAALEKISTVSRDIALKRADMYVENRKFTLQQVREMEQMSINMHMSVMERTLNAAKALADLGIALFNSRVARFNASMERTRVKVATYDAQVRGALGQLEAQRVKLQAATTHVDIQRNQAQIYVMQVEGQKALVDMYRTDIAAMQGLADVERLKLDAFKADVTAYSESLRGETLQLQGYEAQIRGDMSKVEVFRALVQAEASKADIARSQSAIYEANARVTVESVRAGIAAATAQADVYRALAMGTASSNEANAHAYAARTEAFRSIASVSGAIGGMQEASFSANAKVEAEVMRANVALGTAIIAQRTASASSGAKAMGDALQSTLSQVLAIDSLVTSA